MHCLASGSLDQSPNPNLGKFLYQVMIDTSYVLSRRSDRWYPPFGGLLFRCGLRDALLATQECVQDTVGFQVDQDGIGGSHNPAVGPHLLRLIPMLIAEACATAFLAQRWKIESTGRCGYWSVTAHVVAGATGFETLCG
jgi:hypothetical protein